MSWRAWYILVIGFTATMIGLLAIVTHVFS